MSERDLIDELLHARVQTELFGGDHAPRLGRLVILEPLGSGAMGSVFAAYDPRLDRKVAVKLLRSGGAGNAALLLREARALGKLAHPNVVAVYDATETDGIVSIVMELAPGESLRTWIGRGKPWRDVLDVMGQAAAGLSAAHRAGIIHRDVKPDNVMIGPDRVRLVDFGLAHAPGDDLLDGSGTPSYMAPELIAGEPANEASDQFSFGVMLYEALHGERPHSAKNKAELRQAALKAADATPTASSVPSWLRKLVARTLAGDPKARFASMEAVRVELGRDRRRRKRWIMASAAALALATAFGAFGYHRGTQRDVCAGGKDRISAAWPPERIAELRANFRDAPWAIKTADDLLELTQAWQNSHRRVCEATRVQAVQSQSLLELRMRCLDRRFHRMLALSTALVGPLDAEARENASAAVASLPRPERCETLVEPGELELPDDPSLRARVERANADMDRAWAAFWLGRYRAAGVQASVIETDTRDLGFPAHRASLLLLLGTIEGRLGEGARAREHLETGVREAANAHSDWIELEIWARLLRNELFDGNPARVTEWAPFARAAAARVDLSGAEIDGIIAEAERDAGHLRSARELLKRALASSDPLRGDQRALLEMNLGSVELAAGKLDAAETAFGRALALAEAALGKGHPSLGLYLDKLAAVARARGRIRDALARHERVLELRRLVYGDSDRAVATALLHRAQTRIEAGKLTAAEHDLLRAREIRAEVQGANHRRLGEIDFELANLAAARGDAAKAHELESRAARLDAQLGSRARPGDDHGELSLARADAALLQIASLRKAGDTTGAENEARRLLALYAAAGDGISAALTDRIALAEQQVGHRERAAKLFEAALRALADEPSRERLRALSGLAECADGDRATRAAGDALRLLDKMPELDASTRAALERVAKH